MEASGDTLYQDFGCTLFPSLENIINTLKVDYKEDLAKILSDNPMF